VTSIITFNKKIFIFFIILINREGHGLPFNLY
jgi:hypothetical protein